MRDCDGLWYLAALVSAPRQRLSALSLVAHKASRMRRQASSNPLTAADERARVCVSRALHALIERFSRYHPSLGEHLNATLRTGRECVYDPDPRLHGGWEVMGVELQCAGSTETH